SPCAASRSVGKTKSANFIQWSRVWDKISREANRSESQGRIGPRSYVRKKCIADLMGYSDGRAFRKISIPKAPMNKAITSIGGTKLVVRETRHQNTHTAIVRMTVPAYRETVSTPFVPRFRDRTLARLQYHSARGIGRKQSQLIAW